MMYSLAADFVVLAHGAFALFAGLGGLLVIRYRRIAWLHIPAFLWAAWIELSGGICPLTHMENWLRRRGGESTYAGDFIAHYVEMLVYPDLLTRPLQLALGVGLLALNALIYGLILVHRHRARRGSTTT